MAVKKKFAWDETKRQSTIKKHGIDFLDASRIFDGRPVCHIVANYQKEQRWGTIGKLDKRIITVIWTYRGTKIRIITARKARENEKREYHNNHS